MVISESSNAKPPKPASSRCINKFRRGDVVVFEKNPRDFFSDLAPVGCLSQLPWRLENYSVTESK
jgi:hypothetical protein